mgnify:CR=1 FL=1
MTSKSLHVTSWLPSKQINSSLKAVCTGLLFLVSTVCLADNPIISHVYTADPAARVFNGRMYVVTSHDLDTQSGYDMIDYHIFSSDDMINWRDHGVVFDVQTDTSWATRAYAPDMIYRNGRYYLYFPDGANSIGVAVSDNPAGPFIADFIGKTNLIEAKVIARQNGTDAQVETAIGPFTCRIPSDSGVGDTVFMVISRIAAVRAGEEAQR